MKHHLKTHSSSLFLLELVVAILIFSFAGALSLRFFAKSHLWNQEAKVLNYFSNECSMAAELTGISPSVRELEKKLDLLYPDASKKEGSAELYYNENLLLCQKEEADYHYSITYTEKNGLLNCNAKVTDLSSREIIYELSAKHDLGGFIP